MSEGLLAALHRRIPTSLQPLTKRLYFAVKASYFAALGGDLPTAVRIQVFKIAMRILGSWHPKTDVVVELPAGPTFLGAESYDIDALTLGYVWGRKVFPLQCRDRVVVDLGAHKGYFSAWALAHCARHVYSYEPESTNYDRLFRAQTASSRRGDWSCEKAAVGATPGVAELYISNESWAHSLHGEMVDAVSVESVPVVTLPEIMRRVAQEHPDTDVVLKVNVEGAVGEILFPATPEDLAAVVQVDLDHEPGSPYDIGALLDHLAKAGLSEVANVREKLFLVSRSPAGREVSG